MKQVPDGSFFYIRLRWSRFTKLISPKTLWLSRKEQDSTLHLQPLPATLGFSFLLKLRLCWTVHMLGKDEKQGGSKTVSNSWIKAWLGLLSLTWESVWHHKGLIYITKWFSANFLKKTWPFLSYDRLELHVARIHWQSEFCITWHVEMIQNLL